MLKKSEVAEEYQVSQRTVSYWMSRKVIPYVRIGNVVRFDPDEVKKALAGYAVKSVGQENEGGQL
jgi:excisionase family DNA binding protein